MTGCGCSDAYIAAVNRCAPPDNKPTPAERDACLPFLVRELALLPAVRVIVCLGAWGWDGALRALAAAGQRVRPAPRFGHGAEASVGPYVLLGCYHPSQQNTFTGRVDQGMVEAVLRRARELAGIDGGPLSGDVRSVGWSDSRYVNRRMSHGLATCATMPVDVSPAASRGDAPCVRAPKPGAGGHTWIDGSELSGSRSE